MKRDTVYASFATDCAVSTGRQVNPAAQATCPYPRGSSAAWFSHRKNAVHASSIMEPTALLQPGAPVPPFGDGVQAFSMAPGQACPGPTTTVHGLSLTGNAVHASHCDNVLLSASSAPQPLRGAVQAPSAEGTTAVSTLIGEHVPTGSACGPPESATELSRTIARLRLDVGALTASSSAILPAALPGLHVIDEALAAAASQDHSTTSPESRSKLQYTLAALSHQLGCVASLFSGASPAVTPPPAASELPEFRGFQDDAVDWVATINALGARKGWSDNQKWCVALDRLQNPAAAWHRYEGVRQQSWADWSAKLIAAFGRIESDLTATSHSTLATTEQGAIEKHNDEAAAPSANLPYLGDQPHEAPRPLQLCRVPPPRTASQSTLRQSSRQAGRCTPPGRSLTPRRHLTHNYP